MVATPGARNALPTPLVVPGLVTAVLVIAALVTAALVPLRAAASSRDVVGYYTSWSIYARDFHVADIDASRVTHVNYAFANIDGTTGECVLGDPWADVDRAYPGDCWDPGCLRGNFRQLELLKERHPHLKVLISVGGWTWSEHFSAVASTDAGRSRFVASCIDLFVRGELGGSFGVHPGIFDGIDVDWEFPVSGGLHPGRPEDKTNYTELLREFRTQLDALGQQTGEDYLLTIAAAPSPLHVANLEVAELAGILDHLDVMAYDFHGAWEATTNFNAPLHPATGDPGSDPVNHVVSAAVANYIAAGMPPEKIVLGLPFYGRSWTGVAAAGDGLYQPSAGAGPGTWEPGIVDYWDVVQTHEPASVRHWHDEAQVPWLFDGNTFVSYDDPQSIGAKAQLITTQGLAGAMIWELSGDLRGVPAPEGSLLDALHQALCVEGPGRIVDLRVAKSGDDLVFTWTPDPGAGGGHRLYDTDVLGEARSLRAPAHAAVEQAGVGEPSLTLPSGVATGRSYYQLLAVAADGMTEGPN